MLRRGCLIGLALLLGGCVTTKPESYKFLVEEPVSAPLSFTFVDSRPADERVFRTPEQLGRPYFMYGDADFTPNRVEQLKARLQRRFGDRLKDKTVELEQFEVSLHFPTLGSYGEQVGVAPLRWKLVTPDGKGNFVEPRGGGAATAIGTVIAHELMRNMTFGRVYAAVRVRVKVDGILAAGHGPENLKSSEIEEKMPVMFEAAFGQLVREIEFRALKSN